VAGEGAYLARLGRETSKLALEETSKLALEETSKARSRTLIPLQKQREQAHFLSAAVFLQSERNFLRSLPCSPLASASLEHSSEAAV
jgi:hypothetical protein